MSQFVPPRIVKSQSSNLLLMTDSHPCFLAEDSLLQQCDIKFTRRSGPGGQHRNKTETAAVITHRTSGYTGEGSERRSQNQNRSVALRRLRIALALNVRSKGEAADQIAQQIWTDRTLKSKLMISADHWDYPAVITVAIDKLCQVNFEIGKAARLLGLSTGKLSKLFRQDPVVMAWVNQKRHEAGLGHIR